jgi:PAS domain S-box-containing protein
VAGLVKVVVVDDAAEVRTMVRTWLGRGTRFAVVGEGASGYDAIQLAGEHRPDAVLLDIRMPKMDGLAAISGILAAAPGTRVVIYSGVEEPGLEARVRALGGAAVIDKATPLDQLADRLSQVLAAPQPSPEHALRQSEERFRLLVEAVSDYAIFLLDPGGYIVSWNLGAERIKGYRADEALGRHFRMFYPAEARDSGHPEEELVLAARDGRYEEEGWRIRKDGSRFWSNVVITALRDRSGELIGYAKVTRDISERRQMLADRERAAAELAQANARLAEANVRLVNSAEERAQLLAITAHELRTPVRVIVGAADTLADHWADLDQSEQGDLLTSMRTSGGRIRSLLDDLLTAVRLDAGRIDVRPRPTRVRPLLLDAVAHTMATSPEADIAVSCDPDVTVAADPNRLGQILANYLTNAVRYGAPPVRIGVTADGADVRIDVCDDGPGVPPELVPRLYDKFARGPHDGGTGLGLFIVRQLARAQGGDAWYERAGGTSHFVVRLAGATL